MAKKAALEDRSEHRCPLTRGAPYIVAACLSAGTASAEDAGKRAFPATMTLEEPGVEDELSLFSSSSLRRGVPLRSWQTDGEIELSKRLTDTFSLIIDPALTVMRPGARGFQNLETAFKYQFLTDPAGEMILSAGLATEWGRTGAKSVGADNFTTLTPTLYFGKGAGDLPQPLAWARPFALTGQIGYSVPTSGQTTGAADAASRLPGDIDYNPQILAFGLTLQYSMPYLAQSDTKIEFPQFFSRLIPLVEASFKVPVANNFSHVGATGTINPGVLWGYWRLQVGVEALIPMNRASGGFGGRLQLSYSLGDDEAIER